MVRVRKHKSDRVILYAILTLIAIGLVIIYAIGPMRANLLNSAYGMSYESDYFFKHHLLSVGIALAVFFAAFKLFPYEKLHKIAKPLMIVALLASVGLWFLAEIHSPLAICELGACRWLRIGGSSFQPAELLKLGLVIYLADFIATKKQEGTIGKVKDFWVPIVTVWGLSLFLVIVKQSDLGTGLAIIAIVLGVLLISGISLKQYLAALAVVGLAGVAVIVSSPYRLQRVFTFVGTGDNDSSYHVENAMMAIGTGGLTGVGIGNSVQATGYLPESINDSVFAILGETFGFVGLLVILGIFAVIMHRILKVSEMSADLEARLIAVGMFAWMAMHVVANIMSMTGLIPVTGVTLPLLSYGGTSMMFISAGLGLVMQLSCYTEREVIKNEDISSRRGLGGTHYASRRGGTRDSRNQNTR
jgi:cell division protein FtsW